jgi:DNA-binding response OmpR family regulator
MRAGNQLSSRILIIEDERSIAELERDYFEINGFAVEIEQDGNAGLKKALADNFDLIILDLMLPGIDGFEICKQIRKTKDIPILMVSAKKEEFDKIKGLGFGADDYITKPFSPSELVARVKAHLSRYERLMGRRDAENDEIKIRGIVMDKKSRRVYVNNKEAILTTREFDLLAMLASHPNRVFSKEELFERLWDLEAVGDIGTVSVHIRKIREKIEIDPSNPQYIETLWGAGYRFSV